MGFSSICRKKDAEEPLHRLRRSPSPFGGGKRAPLKGELARQSCD